MEAGIIAIWRSSIARIPPGWLLCNGANGTPDLRDRFIIGAGDTYDPDDTGGAVTHRHLIAIDSHFHDLVAGSDILAGNDLLDATDMNSAHGDSDLAGSRPPYNAWPYIMRDDDGLQEFDCPKKLIVAWSGSIVNIPDFWRLCDGTRNTPDLTDRFVLGAGGAFAPAARSGSVNHQHDFTADGHGHTIAAGVGVEAASPVGDFDDVTLDTDVTGTSDIDGSLSPYYALAYIQKF